MKDCSYCAGTGKSRTIAIVGEPAAADHIAASSKITDAVHKSDTAICASDFAQMVCGQSGLQHVREREQTADEIKKAADEVIDITSEPPPVTPQPAAVKAAAKTEPIEHGHEEDKHHPAIRHRAK